MYKNQLEKYRREIDKADKMLIQCLSRRQEIVRRVADLKKDNNEAMLDTARFDQLLIERKNWGRELGLSQELVTGIYERIHADSLRMAD